MPSVLAPVTYEPIRPVRVLSQQGALPQLLRSPEAATQSFKLGVPLRVVAGYMQECTFAAADVVFGVSAEQAHNYASNGGGVSFTLPYIIPPATELNEPASGPPPNQPNAVVIPMGAAPRDGQVGIYGANGSTVFSAALKAGQVFTQALLVPGTFYQLVKDGTSGFWYVDSTQTAGNSAVVNLIGFDPSSPNTVAGGCRVFFQFKSSQREFV